MTPTVRIDQWRSPKGAVFWVILSPGNGLPDLLVECATRSAAIRNAHALAERYGAELRSAEVMPFRRGVAVG